MPNGNDKKDKDKNAQIQEKTSSGFKWTPSSRYEPCTSRDRITSDHSQYYANQQSKQWADRSSTGANRGRGGKS